MTVIIILVQRVIYPQFHHAKNLRTYAQEHVKRISPIVMPVMLLEFFTLVILWFNTATYSNFLIFLITLLLLAIWIVTFFLMLPLHNRITQGEDCISDLIVRNYYRTGLWLVKTGLLVYMLYVSTIV